MPPVLDLPDELRDRRFFGQFTDFTEGLGTVAYTTTATDIGTATVGDAVGGILAMTPSDGTVADNDEIYVQGKSEIFKFAANKPLIFEARLQFTEANTDDLNMAVGFANAPIADTLVDNGAGLKTSFSGACIYKVDGGTVYRFVTSLGSTQTITASTTTAGGASYQTARIEIRPISSTQLEAVPYIDGVQLKDANGYPIKHFITFSGATEMTWFAGMKNGAGTNVETLNLDYIGGWQLR